MFLVRSAAVRHNDTWQPHRDNAPIVGTPGENTREITVLCYLNNEWKTEWGGQLRCHPFAETADQVRFHVSCCVFRLLQKPSAISSVVMCQDKLRTQLLPRQAQDSNSEPMLYVLRWVFSLASNRWALTHEWLTSSRYVRKNLLRARTRRVLLELLL